MQSSLIFQNPDLNRAIVQPIDEALFRKKQLQLHVLRLDLIHPVVSGNKWFKLKYFLKAAKAGGYRGIITRGGAYSNHLLATAYACAAGQLGAIALIRGEPPVKQSPTLIDLQNLGMDLRFISREKFTQEHWPALAAAIGPEYYPVNEGGNEEPGVAGAAEILHLLPQNDYSHLLCAVGTGTMLAGLQRAATAKQTVIGIPVLKIPEAQRGPSSRLESFLHNSNPTLKAILHYEFHEGGYAKHTEALLAFMNRCWQLHQLPTDFVYTGKLLKAVWQLAETDHFTPGSKLLLIHSGGLQGNRSLPAGKLLF